MIQTRSMTGFNQQTNILNPSVFREGIKYKSAYHCKAETVDCTLTYIWINQALRLRFKYLVRYCLSNSLSEYDFVETVRFACFVLGRWDANRKRIQYRKPTGRCDHSARRLVRDSRPASRSVYTHTLRLTRVHLVLGLYARDSRLQDIEGEVKIVGSSLGGIFVANHGYLSLIDYSLSKLWFIILPPYSKRWSTKRKEQGNG